MRGEEMRAAERAAAEIGLTAEILMEAAGAEIARAALQRFSRPGLRVIIFVGPGQNGGDGLTAARHLDAAGARVSLCLLADPERLRGPAALQFERLRAAPEVAVRDLGACRPQDFDLAIDAIFGTSLRPPITGAALAAVRWIEESGLTVLAADLPSGVLCDSGEIAGAAVHAHITVALGALKPGHVFYPGRDHCGEVLVSGLGIPNALYGDAPMDIAQVLPSASLPGAEAPKQAYGEVTLLAGSRLFPGAAWLTARGALRGGAGTAVLASVPQVLQHGSAMPEVIVREVAPTGDGRIDPAALHAGVFARSRALAVGPGLGDVAGRAQEWREFLCLPEIPLCLDADGLAPFAGDPEALRQRRGPTVLTPHRGEAGRLLGRNVGEAAAERLEAALEIARRSGAVTLIKGAPTFIASPDGRVTVVTEGGPELAAPGSGDVLTGLLAAQLAVVPDVHVATVRAAFAHGRAGAILRRRRPGRGRLASEIADEIPPALEGA